GSVAVADACAVREEGVPVRQSRVGVNRDGSDLQLSGERAAIQGFDVAELVDITASLGIDAPRRHRPEHEGIVGVGAVGEPDGHDRVPVVRRTASAWNASSEVLWSSYSGRFRARSAGSAWRKSA